MSIVYTWVDGSDPDFVAFSEYLDDYFYHLSAAEGVGKISIPRSVLAEIPNVLLGRDGETAVACASFKECGEQTAEIKRVYVKEDYRGRHIAKEMIGLLEERARQQGYRFMVLQTREVCADAVSLYRFSGYERTDNYPPYEQASYAICFRKEL